MSTVALIKCDSYDVSDVKAAVKKGIDLLGGVSQFAKSGEKILLKPNFLAGEVPGKCVNTNPRIFRAVAEIFQTTGAKLSYGDSPAFGSTVAASKKAGFTDVAEELGVELADFKEGIEKQFPEGKQNKKFTIAKAIAECDGVISLPKLKTHGFLRFTGCIKNQFGCIPGLLKAEFHVKCPGPMILQRYSLASTHASSLGSILWTLFLPWKATARAEEIPQNAGAPAFR